MFGRDVYFIGSRSYSGNETVGPLGGTRRLRSDDVSCALLFCLQGRCASNHPKSELEYGITCDCFAA